MSALVTHAGTRMVDSGFNASMPKPFTPDKLVETILTVLNGYDISSRPEMRLFCQGSGLAFSPAAHQVAGRP